MLRRRFLLGAVPGALIAPLASACASRSNHDALLRESRRPLAPTDGSDATLHLRELVRFATLAPSSHNTQCWKFRVQQSAIMIEPDLARRCPVVDPDDHHVFVSLGCASENLSLAALATGLHAQTFYAASDMDRIEVLLESTRPQSSALLQAIPTRQCTRGDYDAKPLANAELDLLQAAGSSPEVRLVLLTERSQMEQVLQFVVSGNTAQMHNPAFVAELKTWIRFSTGEADQRGDGLYAAASGTPTMPRWLGSHLMDWVVTAQSENERYARQIRNAAGIAIFIAQRSDKKNWIEVGRCYQRFALQATALGIRNAMLNQPLEVAAIRSQFATALGLGDVRCDLIVRFGRGPPMPYSLRRPVTDVLL